ncbi:aquaporin, partial [Francisella tularensis]|uniref:aquaporin n=1 Tax=Francisella tularensis TaxID=263 RepID=UPI002381B5CC
MLTSCIAELIGTLLLILLGNGVVAGVVLNKSQAHDGGWIVITFAWGLAVFIGVLVAG